ncbi:MAG TPA: glucose-6-phosphate dehydrogenase [bacterium]|jgi:glucose-6-phosphate 1-dehydrogenase
MTDVSESLMELAANPFRSGLIAERPPDPCGLVIFGAVGDLARRKLFPALMSLMQEGKLPESTFMIGVTRREMSKEEMCKTIFDSAQEFAPDVVQDERFREQFAARIFPCTDDPGTGEGFAQLQDMLKDLSEKRGTRGNVLFYLAVPPSAFEPIVTELGKGGLNKPTDGAWARIIVEKPFGHDLDSARKLAHTLQEVFPEEQVYRIDHYMGKEAVQNILVLRLANTILEPLWNNHYIDHVQITAAEALGVEDRAAYYEETGALRDMMQNHLLQILSMIALEPPASLDPEAVRNEKTKVLQAIRRYTPDDVKSSVIRGQYAAGTVGGKNVPGYREEKGVDPKSRTETFCALRLWVDNWRWHGVPFYLRTGKRLPKRITEVAIQFKPVPHMIFPVSPVDLVEPNVLSIRIQPGEGIILKFIVKLPGHAVRLRSVSMEFRYGASFGGRISDAYERLLLDAMLGDPTLFARFDAVEEGWKFAMPLLNTWQAEQDGPLPHYPAGSWGPSEADQLIEQDGREWRIL